ncbi:MAG: hypothetical protein ACXABO_13110 [Promethearchaeota archaeon]|jgi:hypothetical protein
MLVEKNGSLLKMYIDFDKNDEKFYVNYYFDEFKMVLKESLISADMNYSDSKIDIFDHAKCTYLIHFR